MSPTTLFILAAIAVLVLTLAAVGVHLIARLRAQEATGSDSASPASDDNLSEMREIGQRIETLVSQQQEQGETQRQRLAQQIDTVQQTVGEQRVLVDGLRSEMRHEAKRRDHELDDIRTQIASIQQAMPTLTAASPLALPSPEDVSTSTEMPAENIAEINATPDTSQENTFSDDPFAFDSFEAEDVEMPEANQPEADGPVSEITSPMVDLEMLELATDSAEEPPAEDSWAITPDWNEATPAEPEATETVDAEATEAAHAEAAEPIAEPPADSTATVEADDLDIFADVSTFEIVSAPTLDAPQADDTWTAEPDASSLEPDADTPSAPQEESLFEELKIEEMSFQEMSFGEPEAEAFDPEEAAIEIDAIEAALTDLLPGAPQSDAVDAPVEEPDASIFMDTLVSNELATPAPEPVAPPAAESAPEAVPETDQPLEDDIFAPTSFLDADDAVPTADPLAFEEMFVPAPVDAEPPATRYSPAGAPHPLSLPSPLTRTLPHQRFPSLRLRLRCHLPTNRRSAQAHRPPLTSPRSRTGASTLNRWRLHRSHNPSHGPLRELPMRPPTRGHQRLLQLQCLPRTSQARRLQPPMLRPLPRHTPRPGWFAMRPSSPRRHLLQTTPPSQRLSRCRKALRNTTRPPHWMRQ